MFRYYLSCLIILTTALLLVGGCSSSSSLAPATRGALTFNVQWPEVDGRSRLIPDSTDAIAITVYKNQQEVAAATVTRTPGQSQVAARIDDIPVGDVLVNLHALNAAGEVIAISGDVAARVIADSVTPVDIELHLPIEGKLGLLRWNGQASVLDVRTGQEQIVGTSLNNASIMPNGKQMLINTISTIDIVNLDGSLLTRVLDNQEMTVMFNAVSQDGTHIVFSAIETDWNDGSSVWNLYLMRTDGSDLRKLTNHTADDNITGIYYPRISPDNQTLLFVVSDAQYEMHLYRINADGTGLSAMLPEENFVAYPTFTRDGARFAYMGGDGGMYMVDLDGGNKTLLYDFPGDNYPAAFSPDGEWLAFNAGPVWNQCDVYVMKLDGSHCIRLTHAEGVMCQSWASDEPTGANLNIY